MKIILAAVFLFGGVFAINSQTQAQVLVQSEADATLRTYSFGACDWWTMTPGSSGGTYGCEIRPTTIEVPRASDLVRILNLYETRMDQLEARIKVLEDASTRP